MGDRKTTDRELLERILQLVSDGTGWNPYIAHTHLSKDFKEKYTLSDLVWLFYKLEWYVKVIEIEDLTESLAYNPWRGLFGEVMKKKTLSYRIRPEFRAWFTSPRTHAIFIERILQYLDEEMPRIEWTEFTR